MDSNSNLFQNLTGSSEGKVVENLENKLKERNQYFTKFDSIENVRNDNQKEEISLRKNERNKEFDSRRRFTSVINDQSASMKSFSYFSKEVKENAEKIFANKSLIDEYFKVLINGNIEEQYFSIVAIRKLLSQSNPVETAYLNSKGMIEPLMNLLNHEYIDFQYESLWCFTNIASGNSDDIVIIVNKGIIPLLIQKFDSKVQEIQEQAIWAVGNISGDSTQVRDLILNETNTFEKMLFFLKNSERLNLIKYCIFTLSNLCRGKPVPQYEKIKQCIDPTIKAIISYSNDTELLMDAVWIISYITEFYKESFEQIISSKVLPVIVSSLDIQIIRLQVQCIRILSNISVGEVHETQSIIDSGALPYLKRLAFHERTIIRKEACLVISNIAGGSELQTQILIENDFTNILCSVIRTDIVDVQKEAIYALGNLTIVNLPDHARILFESNIIEAILNTFKINKHNLNLISLEMLKRVLDYGEKFFKEDDQNPVQVRLEKNENLMMILESLQNSKNQQISELASEVVRIYFDRQIF